MNPTTPGLLASSPRVRAWIIRNNNKRRRAAAAEPEPEPAPDHALCLGSTPLALGDFCLTIGNPPTPPEEPSGS